MFHERLLIRTLRGQIRVGDEGSAASVLNGCRRPLVDCDAPRSRWFRHLDIRV